MGQRGPWPAPPDLPLDVPEESTWEGLGEMRAEMEHLAPGTRKQLKQFLLWCPGMYNGQRPGPGVLFSVWESNSNKKMHFSHMLLNRDELLQGFIDGDLSTLYFIGKLSVRIKMCGKAGKY